MIDALIDFLKAAPVLHTALLLAGYIAALVAAFVVVGIPLLLIARTYHWYRNPQWRPEAVEARARAAQQQLAERLSGGRRRLFLRRRAQRQAARNPWRAA